MTLMAFMLLLSSTTYAVEVSKSQKQMMFNKTGIDMNNVTVLDNSEMAKTEGEAWWWVVAAVVAFLAAGDSRRNNNDNNGVNNNGTGAFGYAVPGKIW